MGFLPDFFTVKQNVFCVLLDAKKIITHRTNFSKGLHQKFLKTSKESLLVPWFIWVKGELASAAGWWWRFWDGPWWWSQWWRNHCGWWVRWSYARPGWMARALGFQGWGWVTMENLYQELLSKLEACPWNRLKIASGCHRFACGYFFFPLRYWDLVFVKCGFLSWRLRFFCHVFFGHKNCRAIFS